MTDAVASPAAPVDAASEAGLDCGVASVAPLSALGVLAESPSITAALELVRAELAMDVAYVTRIDGGDLIVERLCGDGAAFGIDGGVTVPRDQTYCQQMLDGRLPKVIPDTGAEPRARGLSDAPKATPGAYAGVPLTLADGRQYGALCAVNRQPVALDDRAVHLLTVLARLIADQLERETAARQLSRFAAMVSEAADGITGVSTEGVVMSWNPACERIYGYTAERAVGRNVVDLIALPGEEHALRQTMAAVAGGERIEAWTHHRRADGSTVDISVTLAPIRLEDGEVSFISAIIRDISAQVRRASFHALESAFVTVLADAQSASEAAAGAVRVLGRGLHCDFVRLWELDGDGSGLRCTARWIKDGSPLTEIAQNVRAGDDPGGFGLADGVLQTGERMWIADLRKTAVTPDELAAADAGLRTAVAVPLMAGGTVAGVIEFCSCLQWNDSDTLPHAGQAVLDRLVYSIGWQRAQEAVRAGRDALEVRVRDRTDELQQALRELDAAQRETVHRLSRAVEFRDEDTGEHIARISVLSGEIARRAGLDEQTTAMIERASPLHDVGKVAIPDSVLLKPGPLTHEERAVIETHAEIGYELLNGSHSALLAFAAEIARTHHERYDGRGYPRGLIGEEIPIAGRIVAIADVYDALTSDRVYRPAMTIEGALAILEEGRGTQFDSVLLDHFLSTRANAT